MRACVVLSLTIVPLVAGIGCRHDDPAHIDKPDDPASTSKTTKGDPRPAKGGCVDADYHADLESLGLTTKAFEKSPTPVDPSLGAGSPPNPPPYSLHTFVSDAPSGADATTGTRALCDDHPKIRACFDRVRGKLSLQEHVDARVSVDAKGRLDDVDGLGDETLRACLLDAIAAADLPKPSAPGVWRLRFELVSPAPKTTVDADVVQRVVKGSTPKVRRCFEKALATNPKLSGKLVVGLTIDAGGNVTKASKAGGTLTDPTFVSCALGVMRAMTFPEPDAGSGDFEVPFTFVAK